MKKFLVVLVLLSGCATTRAAHDRRAAAAQDAVAALQAARFDEAEAQSNKLVAADPDNATAHGVAAIAGFRKTLHDLFGRAVGFVATLAASAMLHGSFIDTDYVHHALDDAEAGLAQVATHLEAAAKDPYFSLELCLACWEVDWNRNGEVDDNDRRLLEVEVDADLHPLPEGDPRRRPTFRFDRADVHWLAALVSFQRAVGQVIGAYDLSELGKLAGRGHQTATLKLKDKAHIATAKALVLRGLDEADLTRTLVLAEDDDDREWLPNPRQKSHPLPFPVDDALFETWAGVISDLRGLVEGKTGLSLAEVQQLGGHGREGHGTARGYIDIARMFAAPSDLVLDEEIARRAKRDGADGLEALARDVLGSAFKEQMAPSPLPSRLGRMQGELDRGEDTFARKVRYLFWLN